MIKWFVIIGILAAWLSVWRKSDQWIQNHGAPPYPDQNFLHYLARVLITALVVVGGFIMVYVTFASLLD